MKTVDEELKEGILPCINLMDGIYLYISYVKSYVHERRWLWGWIENEKGKVLLNPVSSANLSLIDLLEEMCLNIENSKDKQLLATCMVTSYDNSLEHENNFYKLMIDFFSNEKSE